MNEINDNWDEDDVERLMKNLENLKKQNCSLKEKVVLLESKMENFSGTLNNIEFNNIDKPSCSLNQNDNVNLTVTEAYDKFLDVKSSLKSSSDDPPSSSISPDLIISATSSEEDIRDNSGKTNVEIEDIFYDREKLDANHCNHQTKSNKCPKEHKTTWSKVKEIITHSKVGGMRKRQNSYEDHNFRSSINYKPIQQVNDITFQGQALQNPTLTITLPSNEDLVGYASVSSSSPGSPNLLQQAEHWTPVGTSSENDQGIKWTKWIRVKNVFLSSPLSSNSSRSAPSSPVRQDSFIFDDDSSSNELLDSPDMPTSKECDISDEIQRDYRKLQRKLSDEFKSRRTNWDRNYFGSDNQLDDVKNCQQSSNISREFQKKLEEWDRIKGQNNEFKTYGSNCNRKHLMKLSNLKTESFDFGKNINQNKEKSKKNRRSSESSKEQSRNYKHFAWLERELAEVDRDKKKLNSELDKLKEREMRSRTAKFESSKMVSNRNQSDCDDPRVISGISSSDESQFKYIKFLLLRLKKMKMSLRLRKSFEQEILIPTSTGTFRFQGISQKFTKKLYEWEKARGIQPEESTFTLLDTIPRTNNKISDRTTVLVRSKSIGSVAELSNNNLVNGNISNNLSTKERTSSLSLNDVNDIENRKNVAKDLKKYSERLKHEKVISRINQKCESDFLYEKAGRQENDFSNSHDNLKFDYVNFSKTDTSIPEYCKQYAVKNNDNLFKIIKELTTELLLMAERLQSVVTSRYQDSSGNQLAKRRSIPCENLDKINNWFSSSNYPYEKENLDQQPGSDELTVLPALLRNKILEIRYALGYFENPNEYHEEPSIVRCVVEKDLTEPRESLCSSPSSSFTYHPIYTQDDLYYNTENYVTDCLKSNENSNTTIFVPTVKSVFTPVLVDKSVVAVIRENVDNDQNKVKETAKSKSPDRLSNDIDLMNEPIKEIQSNSSVIKENDKAIDNMKETKKICNDIGFPPISPLRTRKEIKIQREISPLKRIMVNKYLTKMNEVNDKDGDSYNTSTATSQSSIIGIVPKRTNSFSIQNPVRKSASASIIKSESVRKIPIIDKQVEELPSSRGILKSSSTGTLKTSNNVRVSFTFSIKDVTKNSVANEYDVLSTPESLRLRALKIQKAKEEFFKRDFGTIKIESKESDNVRNSEIIVTDEQHLSNPEHLIVVKSSSTGTVNIEPNINESDSSRPSVSREETQKTHKLSVLQKIFRKSDNKAIKQNRQSLIIDKSDNKEGMDENNGENSKSCPSSPVLPRIKQSSKWFRNPAKKIFRPRGKYLITSDQQKN